MANSSSSQGQLQRAGVQTKGLQRLVTDKRSLKASKKNKKLRASHIRESMSGRPFTEEGQNEKGKNGQKNRVYLVTIIEEGLGNSKDKNYYSADALQSGTQVFDGAKAYADHPDAITEKTLPERSMKDLVGWYSDCFTDKNPQTGKVRLRGKLHFFPSAKWLTDMIDTILTDKSAKNLFGISINAVGRTRPAQMGGEEVNYVEEFQRVDSADVVTEPAARGKFDQMLESRRSVTGGHSRKVSTVMGQRTRRTREAASLSPEKAKEVADSLVSAYNSDNPDEMKEAMFAASKELHAVSSISGKGPGQPNEEQYSNINPSGGSNEMAKKKMKASTGGGRSFRKGKRRIMASDGTGEDNEDVPEPDPGDIEPRLEESDVEDEEGDQDLGQNEDFGGGKKHYATESGGRGRRMVRRGRTQEGFEDEGFEDEDEGFEDEDDMGPSGAPGAGAMPAMSAPGGGAPGSSRTVASAEAGDDDDDDDGDDDDDDLDDMDEAFEDEDEGFEDEDEGFEDEDEGMEDEGSMTRPGTVAESRMRRRRMVASGRRRRMGREAGRASGQGQTVSSASFAGGLGHSGNTSLPKGADPTKGYDPGGTDEDFGKKDDSTSAVGKSYKIKTSKYRRNKVARRVAQEANRRIEILEHNLMRLRESKRATERKLNRYVGIVRFTESQKRAHRLLSIAVDKGVLPEEMAESRPLRESLYGLNQDAQIREIKKTALLLESAQEGVVSRLTESVEGSGARGGAASYFRTAGAEDSELAGGFADDGIPIKDE